MWGLIKGQALIFTPISTTTLTVPMCLSLTATLRLLLLLDSLLSSHPQQLAMRSLHFWGSGPQYRSKRGRDELRF